MTYAIMWRLIAKPDVRGWYAENGEVDCLRPPIALMPRPPARLSPWQFQPRPLRLQFRCR